MCWKYQGRKPLWYAIICIEFVFQKKKSFHKRNEKWNLKKCFVLLELFPLFILLWSFYWKVKSECQDAIANYIYGIVKGSRDIMHHDLWLCKISWIPGTLVNRINEPIILIMCWKCQGRKPLWYAIICIEFVLQKKESFHRRNEKWNLKKCLMKNERNDQSYILRFETSRKWNAISDEEYGQVKRTQFFLILIYFIFEKVKYLVEMNRFLGQPGVFLPCSRISHLHSRVFHLHCSR